MAQIDLNWQDEQMQTTEKQQLPGFRTMFRQEMRLWWGSGRRWLPIGVLTLLGLVAIPIAIALLVQSQTMADPETLWIALIKIFVGLAGFSLPILTIILASGNVSEEIKTGTAEWIISKPISRDAFVLAKLAATWVGIVTTSLLLPLVAFYIVSAIVVGSLINPLPLLSTMFFLLIYMTFLISVTTLISCQVSGRAGDIGLAFVVIILQGLYNSTVQTINSAVQSIELPEFLLYLMPSTLTRIGSGFIEEITWDNMFFVPLISTGLLIVLSVFLSLFAFRRKEF